MERIFIKETKNFIGENVLVSGWVKGRRDHGKIIFIDLRDISGILQLVFTPDNKEVYKKGDSLRKEWVVEIFGRISKRPKGMENKNLETGEIELKVEKIKILSEARDLPISIDGPGYDISEEKRLRFRYIDLRRERLKRNLITRQKIIHFMREFLINKGFIEIETPVLTKSTPEGARDFVVPSRLHPGKFYALPQSPQQFKQMLQVAGFERYFQVARAIRDEDPRADRQAEHTQLDLEMSFATQDNVMNLVEKLYINLIEKLFPEKKIKEIPFPRIDYKEAIEQYKTDRPDIRNNKNDPNELAFCFVVNFPMFEWKSGEKRWGAMHHPFTKPQTENIKEIKNHPEKILAFQYDIVLNGSEIGGGSERTTNLDVLTAVFEVLGHKPEEIRKNFHNYFEAFQYGVPPHAGIAQGIDRLAMILLNEKSIREVIAFPKTGDGRDLMMEAPAEITHEQLRELHIKIENKEK